MKKRIFCLFLATLMIVLLLPIEAFAATAIKGAFLDVPFSQEIGTVIGATGFSKGGSIPDGLKVSASYQHKNTYNADVLTIKLSGTPTKAGSYSFSVSGLDDNGKVVQTLNYTMTVGEKAPFAFADAIEMEAWPKKTVYYLGDTLDTTGMKVVARVYNYDADREVYVASEYDVTEYCSCNPTVFTFDEAQNVTVSCSLPCDQFGTLKTLTTTFRVTFNYANPEDVTSIEVVRTPDKTTYTVGESLSTTGLAIRAHKGSGATEDLVSGFTCEPTTLKEVGTQTVTVTYKEKTATFNVTVTEAPAVVTPPAPVAPEPVKPTEPEKTDEPETPEEPEEPVVEPTMMLLYAPNKTEYLTGESLDPTGLALRIQNGDGSVEDITKGYTCEVSDDMMTPGLKTVTVDYNGMTVTFTINVTEAPEEPILPEPVEPIPEEKTSIPFWIWIIIGLLVVALGATVALFLIGRKRLEDEE